MLESCISESRLEDSGFNYTMSLIQGKYRMLILYTLGGFGVVRFNEMKKYIGEISFKTLSATLKRLEADGLVHREEYPQIPPKVEYSLTEEGRSFSNASVSFSSRDRRPSCRAKPTAMAV